ncbi:glycoside hydrolase [Streptomyces sp. BE303]|uniref:glycoside hydrolase n=1 Tax=Streptomyces sp. BE303 TaxID=3002528 RepID=UPI002E7949D8|nr:glycoside hydrolase [Streptomyces sp. BE303]MED7951520.1 glycoside hydrolase [Streptomyces sp. BE303]
MERRTVLRGLVGVPVGAMAVVAAAGPARADFTTTVNPSHTWGTWEGWGTSLAWWANQLGPQEDLADVLFSRKTVQFHGETVPGLGMNVVRYNAGASGTNSIGGRTMKPVPALDGFKKIEGYQLDWFSDDPQSASWNWNADANQRDMMWLARDRGADKFELFTNSPMWWMLKNDDPRGAVSGHTCNLQDGNFGRHAAYLATVARYAHDHWGIDFTSVQPVNEPLAKWEASTESIEGQEGCHYDRPQIAEIVRQTRAQLDVRGLHWMMVAGLDDWGVGSAVYNWTNNSDFDAATRAAVGRVNVHGYEDNGDRYALHQAVAADNKDIWMSEYGDGDTSGMLLARNLNYDLRWLHPTAWVIWQILDWNNYGAISLTNGVIGAVNPKFYVLAQYIRHIRPGMTIIDAGHPDAVAAYDGVNHKLVIVAVNYGGDGQTIDFDLSRFSTPGQDNALIGRWATGTNPGGERYRYYEDTYLHGNRFWSTFNARTVQTFEVSGVYL